MSRRSLEPTRLISGVELRGSQLGAMEVRYIDHARLVEAWVAGCIECCFGGGTVPHVKLPEWVDGWMDVRLTSPK